MDVLVKANAMPVEDRKRSASVESSVLGPRWAFGPAWLDRQVQTFNTQVLGKNWERVRITWQREEKSLMQKCIVFRLEGQAYPIQAFMDLMDATIAAINEGVI